MSQPSKLTAPQSYEKRPTEGRWVAVSMAGKLDGEELLTGTPTATSVPSGLTITSVAITTETKRINGVNVAAGKAVICYVAGGTLDVDYDIIPKCLTTSGQDVEGVCVMRIRPR